MITKAVGMKAHHKERLHKLADFLDTLKRPQFDFGLVAKKCEKTKEITCGTIACAIGWTPMVFPRLVYWRAIKNPIDGNDFTICPKGKNQRYDFQYIGSMLFGIPKGESEALFAPGEWCPWNNNREVGFDASPKHVSHSIRRFVKWKEKGGSL